MTKKNNANSARRKLIPAVGMLVASAMMLSSSTYAWFTMSDSVTVDGMNINATSEGGIVVSNGVTKESDAQDAALKWATVASAVHTSGANLLPTSTQNATNWYYNISDNVNDAKAHQSSYTSLTLEPDTNGIGKDTTANTSLGSYGFYLVNDFYIKSSTVAINDQVLTVKSLTVTPTHAGDTGSADLNKSLRVAVVLSDQKTNGAKTATYIYNPLSGDDSYWVNNAESKFTVTTMPTDGTPTKSTLTIPDNTSTTTTAINAKIYLYFEGEDKDCKSANITSDLDNLAVTVQFGLATPDTP